MTSLHLLHIFFFWLAVSHSVSPALKWRGIKLYFLKCISMCKYSKTAHRVPASSWLFIHSPSDRHLSRFHFGAITNNAANHFLYILLFVWTCIFGYLGYNLRSGFSGSFGKLCLTFWRTTSVLERLHHFTFPPAINERSHFSTSWTALYCLFVTSYNSECEVLSPGFDLYFPNE